MTTRDAPEWLQHAAEHIESRRPVVYIAVLHWYEDSEIIGAYSTRERAEQAIALFPVEKMYLGTAIIEREWNAAPIAPWFIEGPEQ